MVTRPQNLSTPEPNCWSRLGRLGARAFRSRLSPRLVRPWNLTAQELEAELFDPELR